MIQAPILANEAERLKEVYSLNLLDTPPEERFDRLIRLAKTTLEVPIAYVALLDDDRQWFKSECGMGLRQTSRSVSFCHHAIAKNDLLIVEDATLDPRFAESPLVTGPPYVRFYAGRPLKGPSGQNVGTLCVNDTQVRKFSQHEIQVLNDLADVAERELQMEDALETHRELLTARQALDSMQMRIETELNEASSYVCAQLPARLDHPDFNVDWKFVSSSHLGGDMFGYFPIEDGKWVVYLLDVAGHGIGSSLLASTVNHQITRRTLPNTDYRSPRQVARALNRAFPMQQHQNKFFTLWYGVYDPRQRVLTYTTAGHHAGLLIPADKAKMRELWQQNLMIGVSSEHDFSEEQVAVEPGAQLFVFSDGVFEVGVNNRNTLGYHRLRDHLVQELVSHEHPVEGIFDFIADWQQSSELTDDFSVLHATMP